MLPAEQKIISVFETKRGFLPGVQSRSWEKMCIRSVYQISLTY